MLNILAVLQGIFVLSMILLVLIQRSSSDSLANLAGSGSKSIHSSGKMDFAKKGTIFFATAFLINSLLMAKLVYQENHNKKLTDLVEESKKEITLDDEN
jgi:preprotein translocase subunit SecG